MKLRILCLLVALAGLAPAQISAPSPGFVRYKEVPIQKLLGIPGNLVIAGSVFGPAEATAFSDTDGLIASNGTIKLVEKTGKVLGTFPYGGAAPLLQIEGGRERAMAWLPSRQTVVWWDRNDFLSTAVNDPGAVSSVLLLSPTAARLLITNPDHTVSAVTVALPDGNIVSSTLLPGIRGPAFQFGDRLIWADEDGLQVERSNGTRHVLPLPGAVFTAEQMSASWVHLFFRDNGSHWALHFGDEPSLSMLPLPVARAAR